MSGGRVNIRKTGLIANKPIDTIKELDDTVFDAQLDETTTRIPIADNIDIPTESQKSFAHKRTITDDNDNGHGNWNTWAQVKYDDNWIYCDKCWFYSDTLLSCMWIRADIPALPFTKVPQLSNRHEVRADDMILSDTLSR